MTASAVYIVRRARLCWLVERQRLVDGARSRVSRHLSYRRALAAAERAHRRRG